MARPHLEQAARTAPQPGAPAAFAQLYHENFDFIFRTLRHLGVPAAALPDAVQEVWLAVHRRLSSFEGRSSLRTWLFSIALNTARNQQRSQRRRAADALPDELVDPGAGPERLHEGREALALVQEFLDTLDETRRVLFISQLIEELSAAECGELLNIDANTVYHRVRDLRRGFRRWMSERRGEQA